MTGLILQPHEVRAVLDTGKVAVRRVCKPQLPYPFGYQILDDPGFAVKVGPDYPDTDDDGIRSPFGVPGERRFCKETWRDTEDGWIIYRADSRMLEYVDCKPTGQHDACIVEAWWSWRSSTHMPTWASRLTLVNVATRVEQLQKITQESARMSGVRPSPHRAPSMGRGCDDRKWSTEAGDCYRCPFIVEWNRDHGAAGLGWDTNPFVWVGEFEREDAT